MKRAMMMKCSDLKRKLNKVNINSIFLPFFNFYFNEKKTNYILYLFLFIMFKFRQT